MIILMILIVVVLYLTTAIVVVKLLIRRGKSKSAKWLIGSTSALVFILIPIWDEIAGRISFNHLCKTLGGQKIIKSVELGNEVFLAPGDVDTNTAGRVPAKGGELNHEKLKERFSITSSSEKASGYFRIEKDTRIVGILETTEVLATNTRLFYFGGWLVNSTGLHVSGEMCPERNDQNYREFYANVFKRGAK
jgi:hypothetical protein